MKFRIRSISGNIMYIQYGDITFPVTIERTDGKYFINKHKSIYITQEAYAELIEFVMNYWRLMNQNEQQDNITQQDNSELS